MGKRNRYLTKQQEIALGRKIKAMREEIENGCLSENSSEIISEGNKAVETFIESYKNLVGKQARSFKNKYPSSGDLDDIIQEGMCGLLIAISRYDPDRDCKLSTFATHWIYQSINRNINNTSRMIRLPENKVALLTRANSLREKYSKETSLSDSEIDRLVEEDLGLKKSTYSEIRKFAYEQASLDFSFGSDTDVREVCYSSGLSSYDSFRREEAVRELESITRELSPYDRDVLVAYMMLSSDRGRNGEKVTVGKISEKYGVSRVKVKEDRERLIQLYKDRMIKKGFSLTDFS